MIKEIFEWESVEDGVNALIEGALIILNDSNVFKKFGPVNKENVYTDVMFKASAFRMVEHIIGEISEGLERFRQVMKPEVVDMVEEVFAETKRRLEVRL